MDHEIRAFRLGDVLSPKTMDMTPKNIRLFLNIRENLPKAFHWSDKERMIFVAMEPGKKDPAPRILLGEYNHVAEMVPKDHPNYTLIFEPETERTLIFDGTRHWKWKSREGWITARRKNAPEPQPVEEVHETYVPDEELVLV